ncbi:MAG: hypothetical protein Q9178_006566 [Gyalolechia marmorata]
MAQQSPLFTLPREIRDDIYNLLLNWPNDPPDSPAAAGLRYREVVGTFGDRSVFYPPPTLYCEPASALSQCSSQIRQELYELVTNGNLTKSMTYELDVMLKGCMTWPTWTNLPYPVRKMEHLQANLRLFDIKDGASLFWGAGGPGLVFVVLFSLLNRLLHHGPRFIHNEGEVRGLEVDLLTINMLPGYGEVLRPDDERFENDPDPVQKCQDYIKRDHARIHMNVCSLLHAVISQGLLSEKVRTVRVRLGRKMEEYRVLPGSPHVEPRDEWKRWGFVWGVDHKMKVEKIESSAFLGQYYCLLHGQEQDEGESEALEEQGGGEEQSETLGGQGVGEED